MWKRPVLCRLCECPASDGGVRVDQLDAEKLSEWMRRVIGVEFELETSTGREDVICQFCLWDARREHNYSVRESSSDLVPECDWWSGYDNNKFFHKYYYQDDSVKRCKVDVSPSAIKIASSDGSHLIAKTPLILDKQFQPKRVNRGTAAGLNKIVMEESKIQFWRCFLCAQRLPGRLLLFQHVHKFHPGQFVQCEFSGRKGKKCHRVFKKEKERKEHMLEDHRVITRKCEFCDMWCDIKSARQHMRKFHKNLIRCSYHQCATYFCSEAEKQKHEDLDHDA